MDCTFWDNWAHLWNEYDNKLDEVGHLDILLMFGKVKYWDSKYKKLFVFIKLTMLAYIFCYSCKLMFLKQL